MRQTADILKISTSMKLLAKMKNVSFVLHKKLNELFGQPNNNNTKKIKPSSESKRSFCHLECLSLLPPPCSHSNQLQLFLLPSFSPLQVLFLLCAPDQFPALLLKSASHSHWLEETPNPLPVSTTHWTQCLGQIYYPL